MALDRFKFPFPMLYLSEINLNLEGGITMNDIVLVLPAKEHEFKANELKNEFFDYGEKVINGSGLLDQLEYTEWLEHTEKYREEETAGDDWVPSTTFFAVRKEDRKIVGMIDIRHHIQHPFLLEYGGHIGYAVRPMERRKGYASKILELALEYAREIGLDKVMLGCYTDNTGSIKTIQKYGGKLVQEKLYSDGKPMYIYWISLTK